VQLGSFVINNAVAKIRVQTFGIGFPAVTAGCCKE